MKVILAKTTGFCMGVRRAFDLAHREAERPAGKVYTLGPLIHNPQALEELKNMGIAVLEESVLPENLAGVSVIIRAHGIPPNTENELRRRGAEVIDATCPRVKASQVKAAALAKAGYSLFLAGEESHAEITGLLGYAAANAGETKPFCAVVHNAAAAKTAAAELYAAAPKAKTALIGQTTISPNEYRIIGDEISRFFPNLEIANTICAATFERQNSLRELLNSADAIVVAGGKESANTRRLLSIAEEAGKPCALVETAADIPADFYDFNTVGLAAGASTPDFVIEAIRTALLQRPPK